MQVVLIYALIVITVHRVTEILSRTPKALFESFMFNPNRYVDRPHLPATVTNKTLLYNLQLTFTKTAQRASSLFYPSSLPYA